MYRRSRFAAVALSAFVAIGVMSEAAFAAPKDAAVKKAEKDAMDNDFITANFPDAEKKLSEAIKTCGASACSPKVKAMLYIHLGVVQISAGNAAAGEASFVEGLKLDATASPEAELMENKDVEKGFSEAKKKAGGGGAAATPTTLAAAPRSSDELTHTAVAEQMVNTPVPIFVQVPQGLAITKVIVMYKPFGGEWKKLELQKQGEGYGGLVPCAELGATGDLKYYIKAIDSAGDPIASAGKADQPFVTKIKNQLDGEAPHLPGLPPPAQCAAKEDCPPGLPGCPGQKKRGEKGLGASCEITQECQSGLVCKGGQCEEGKEETAEVAERPASSIERNMIGLHVSADLAYISGDDVCGRTSQKDDGYACFKSDGDHYHGAPLASGSGNAINAGLSPSTIRVMASYDRVLGGNFSLGTRLGYAFNGGPKPDGGNAFLPFHAELRGSYWFGSDPFASDGFRPFVFLTGGLAQVDTKVRVSVKEDAATCDASTDICSVQALDGTVIQENPPQQKLDAWRKSGQGFVGLGGGVMYAIKRNMGPIVDVKIAQMFPTAGTVIAPELGWVMSF